VKGDIEPRERERERERGEGGRERLGLDDVADCRKIAFLHYDEIKVPFRVTVLPRFLRRHPRAGLRT
jgi:hypothetical protein